MTRPSAFAARQPAFGRARRDIGHSDTQIAIEQVGSKPWTGQGTHPHIVGTSIREAVRHEETPPVAASAADDEAEHRHAPRFTLLIRAAKLIGPGGEFLCVVRDASQTGVSVRLFHPLPANVPLTLEMPNGDQLELERVWETEGKAGFRFASPVDIERIVESPSQFLRRAVRVNIEVPCELLVGTRRVSGAIHNLSQQGAQIATGERLSLLQRVKIRADGMPEIAAKVRWRRNDSYGLSFEDTFQFAELAALVFDLRRAG